MCTIIHCTCVCVRVCACVRGVWQHRVGLCSCAMMREHRERAAILQATSSSSPTTASFRPLYVSFHIDATTIQHLHNRRAPPLYPNVPFELLTCTVHHNLTYIVYRSGDNCQQRDKYSNFWPGDKERKKKKQRQRDKYSNACPRDKERKRRKSKDMLHELGSFPRVNSPDSSSMDRGAVGGLRPPSEEAASDASGVSPADGFTSPVHSMATSKMTTTHHGNTRARMPLAPSPCVEVVMSWMAYCACFSLRILPHVLCL